MAIVSMDGLVAAFPAYGAPFLKTGFTPAVSAWHGLWAVAGNPGAGANSADGAAGAIPTDATAGAFPFTNVASTYLARFAAWSTQIGTLLLYDRLWHNSGLSVTTVGNQTVNSVALTRPDANGAAAEAWLQVYTTLGAGSTAKTIAYTNSAGTGSRTGTLAGFAATAVANRCFPFTFAAGDTGVKSIQGFDNVATSTSGTFGLIIRRQLAVLPIGAASVAAALDGIALGLPRVYDDACLELVWQAGAGSATVLGGQLVLAQG